jgi:CheY-like chemotaxis protein
MENAAAQPQHTGLLITGDLIFSTKIAGTARLLGLDVRVVSSASAALDRMRSDSPPCILLDLSVSSLTPESVREIVLSAAGKPVVAFGSHVDTARLDTARAAGCTAVLPRSRFSAELPELLKQYFRPLEPRP